MENVVIMGYHKGSTLIQYVLYSTSGLLKGIVFGRLCNVLLEEYKGGSKEIMFDISVVIDITAKIRGKVVPR
jgi:hypothetical protein